VIKEYPTRMGNGEGYPPPSDYGFWRSVMSFPSWVGAEPLAENEFGAFCLLCNHSGGKKIQCVYR